jgi:hypothetical protein
MLLMASPAHADQTPMVVHGERMIPGICRMVPPKTPFIFTGRGFCVSYTQDSFPHNVGLPRLMIWETPQYSINRQKDGAYKLCVKNSEHPSE